MYFQNRQHAGQLLANKLEHLRSEKPVILALPRGGVAVAVEVAKFLEAPLDVLIVRKIGSPFNSELAVGALCEGGEPLFNDYLLSQLGLNPDDLISTVKQEKIEIERQLQVFRNNGHLPSLAKRTVIIVDDGLATGATMLAAIQCLEKKGSKKIIVAVPIAASLMVQSLRKKVDEVVTVEERTDLWAVGRWYEDFSQASDEEVSDLLHEVKQVKRSGAASSVEKTSSIRSQ